MSCDWARRGSRSGWSGNQNRPNRRRSVETTIRRSNKNLRFALGLPAAATGILLPTKTWSEAELARRTRLGCPHKDVASGCGDFTCRPGHVPRGGTSSCERRFARGRTPLAVIDHGRSVARIAVAHQSHRAGCGPSACFVDVAGLSHIPPAMRASRRARRSSCPPRSGARARWPGAIAQRSDGEWEWSRRRVHL